MMNRLPQLLENLNQMQMREKEHLAHIKLLEQDLKMVKEDADLFKKEANLYFSSLLELNRRFKGLEDLKQAAEGKIQSLQEQVEATKKKLTIQEKALEQYKA